MITRFAAALLSLAATAATAEQPPCAPRDRVLDHLAEQFGETRQSIGLAANGQVMEMFASDTTGSWTITVTLPTGLTCLVASGRGFERLAEALPPQT